MPSGTVEFFDVRKGFGNIKGEDEKVYFFSKSALSQRGKPEKQQKVEFKEDTDAEVKEGQKAVAIEVAPVEGETFNSESRRRNKKTTEGGAEGTSSKGLESRMDKIEKKLNEICEKLDISKLSKGGRKGRGKGRKGGKGDKRSSSEAAEGSD